MILFFFKQKTAYEMRISDWSSDVCSSDLPRIKGGAFDPRPHPHQRPKVQRIANMTEIGPELFPARKALTPGPWLPHFGHREFIERNLRIHPCAGIAIPVPDAARIGRRIDQQHVEPGVTQLVEQVDPAEA